jgi:hypothetical protein
MNYSEKKVWFPAKKYGWGWGPPCSWEGWVVMLVWLALLVGGGVWLAPRGIPLFVGYAVVLGAVLFAVALVKGEPPRWRWGESQDWEGR